MSAEERTSMETTRRSGADVRQAVFEGVAPWPTREFVRAFAAHWFFVMLAVTALWFVLTFTEAEFSLSWPEIETPIDLPEIGEPLRLWAMNLTSIALVVAAVLVATRSVVLALIQLVRVRAQR